MKLIYEISNVGNPMHEKTTTIDKMNKISKARDEKIMYEMDERYPK